MAHNGGKACAVFDLATATYYTAFLNVFKQCNYMWYPTAGVTGDWRSLFDDRDYPIAMPAGGAHWRMSQVWIWGDVGDTWVLDWPNATTTMALDTSPFSGLLTETIVSSTRREYSASGMLASGTWPNGTPIPASITSVTITGMSANDFASGGIRLYLKNGSPSGIDHETRLNNGEIYDPHFYNKVNKFGVLHFENWSVVNQGSPAACQWTDRQQADACTFWGFSHSAKNWCGASSGTNAQVVSQPPTPVASWTQGRRVQFEMTSAPVWHTVVAVTTGSPTTIQSTAHGLSNGDQIQFAPGANVPWKILSTNGGFFSYRFLTVTVTDANHFTVPVDSTGFGAYSGHPWTKVCTLTVGGLSPVKMLNSQGASTLSAPAGISPGGFSFLQETLQAGDIVDCVYDASLNALLCGRAYDSSGTVSIPYQRQVPFESIVALCNQGGNHCYINVSPFTDDDFITNLATFLKNNLNSGLTAMIELSNEVWNYNTTGYCEAKSFVDVGQYNPNFWYGKRCSDISNIFKSVYGNQGGTGSFQILIAVQTASGGQGAQFGNNGFCTDRFISFPYVGKTATISIANPAVITTSSAHGRQVGDLVVMTTTGTLPSPFADTINFNSTSSAKSYYVVSVPSSTQMQLATTPGGTPISTLGGSQSGTHTIAQPVIANCHGLVHAPYFDSPILGWGGLPPYYPDGTAPVQGTFADHVYNSSQGPGAGRQAAFDFYKASLLFNSLNEAIYPSNGYFCIEQHQTYTGPFWNAVAASFGVECHEYEGGQNAFGSGNTAGFPVTITTGPNTGQNVSIAMVDQFMLDFYASQQFADCITAMFNGSHNLGTKFPAQYTLIGPTVRGSYWAIQPTNVYGFNGFASTSTSLAYQALRTFNDLIQTTVAPLRLRLHA